MKIKREIERSRNKIEEKCPVIEAKLKRNFEQKPDYLVLILLSSLLTANFFIAFLTKNMGFGPGFLYSDWKNSSCGQSNLEPY